MNGSETLMGACSRLRSQVFKSGICNQRILRSWLRLRCAARLLASLRGAGLPLLITSGLRALSPLAALALPVIELSVLALTAPAALFARCEVGRRRLFLLADDDPCAIGQIGKARCHH